MYLLMHIFLLPENSMSSINSMPKMFYSISVVRNYIVKYLIIYCIKDEKKMYFSIFQGDDGIDWYGRRLFETLLWWMFDCKLPSKIGSGLRLKNCSEKVFLFNVCKGPLRDALWGREVWIL